MPLFHVNLIKPLLMPTAAFNENPIMNRSLATLLSIFLALLPAAPAMSSTDPSASTAAVASSSTPTAEAGANSQSLPTQILRTGVNLNARGLSPNTMQLADSIGMTPLLTRMQLLSGQVSEGGPITLEKLSARQDLSDVRSRILLLIQKTDLEIDFTLAEIGAEEQVYSEILSAFSGDRTNC